MVLKRGLSAVLSFSMATSAMLPFAAQAQSAKSDSVVLILQALAAKNPAEAKALLQKAEAKIDTEKLSDDSQADVRELLRQAQAKYSTSLLSGKKLIAIPGASADAVPASDAATALASALTQNPSLHAALKEISEGRLERDSGNLVEILKTQTNQTVAAADQSNSAVDQILSSASSFIKSLRDHGLVKDWAATNRALRLKHPSISVDELANYAIYDSVQWSILAGVAKKLIQSESPAMFRNGGAVTAEAFGSFVVNINLVLRIADLYGMNLAEHEADTAILVLLPLGKVFGHFAMNKKTYAETISGKLGSLFAEVRSNPNPATRQKFLVAVFSSSLMAGALKRTVGFDPKASPALPAAAATKVEGTIANLESDAARAESAAVTAGETAGKVVKSVGVGGLVAKALWGTLVSGGETIATGVAAKYWFRYQKMRERQLQTRDFKKFLEEKNARGFFKLLIATMNSGATTPHVIDPRNAKKDPAVNFIMGIARSIRICSPNEFDQYKALKEKMDAHIITKATKLLDYQYRLLRFQCDSNLGFSRYNQIVREFMTFNAIPDLEVAQLRLASYEQRMQMGELLMQLQFMLNGEPSSDQVQFFDTTISKFLGLTRPEDSVYFSRYYGFIHGQGGMTPDASNPSGWAVKTAIVDDPFTSTGGYTDPSGPDLPAPPVSGPGI